MNATIYKPTKSAMQSGVRNKDYWIIEFAPTNGRYTEPLMGWTGSTDMTQEIKLKFTSKEEAISYAESKGLTYQVIEPKQKAVWPKSYAENFTN